MKRIFTQFTSGGTGDKYERQVKLFTMHFHRDAKARQSWWRRFLHA